jgi:hypothetical protein
MCDADLVKGPKQTDDGVLAALAHLMATYNALHTDQFRNTTLGHWVNEAFVVRLWAVLESHRAVSPIDHSLDGAAEVDICRRLRHEIGHAKGDVDDREARELERRIRSTFTLDNQQSLFDGKFILSKDKVLRPMFAACQRYCVARLARGD